MVATTWGADPDAAPVTWEEKDEERAPYQLRFGPLADMVFYFTSKAPFSQTFTHKDKTILASAFKRMFNQGVSEKDMRRNVNRFYLTDAARTIDEPCKLFASNKYQILLSSEGESKTDAMRFIANGMNRHADDDLPWDESFDAKLLTEFATDPAWLSAVLTYPDVVASLLMRFPSDEVYPYLDSLASQIVYLRKDGPKPKSFAMVKEAVPTPKSLRFRGVKVRARQDSMAEAVIQARQDAI